MTPRQFGEMILKGFDFGMREGYAFLSGLDKLGQEILDPDTREFYPIKGCATTLGLFGFLNGDKVRTAATIFDSDGYTHISVLSQMSEVLDISVAHLETISDIHWSSTATAREIAASLIEKNEWLLSPQLP